MRGIDILARTSLGGVVRVVRGDDIHIWCVEASAGLFTLAIFGTEEAGTARFVCSGRNKTLQDMAHFSGDCSAEWCDAVALAWSRAAEMLRAAEIDASDESKEAE